MSRSPLFPALVATLRNVAFWVSGFWLATFLDTRQIQGLRFLPFLAAALVICLFFWWFLGKPRPLPVVAGAGALLTLLTSWLLLSRFSTLEGILFHLAAVAAVGLVVGRTVYLILRPLTAEKNMLGMETAVLFLLFFLVVQTGSDLSPGYVFPLLMTTVLSLFLVFCQRLLHGVSQTRSHWPALAAIGGLLAAVLLAAGLFLLYGVDALARGTVAAGNGIRAFFRWLTDLLNTFLGWLFSFLPEPDYHGMDVDPILMPSADQLPSETLTTPLPPVLGLLFLAVLFLLAGFLLVRYRRHRLGGLPLGREAGRVRHKRLSLLAWAKAILSQLKTELRLHVFLLTHRNSPQALYYTLQRRLRKTPLAKSTGEAPCAFLRRLAGQAEDPVTAAQLEALAVNLGAQLYSPAPPESLPTEIPRAIRRAIPNIAKARTSP